MVDTKVTVGAPVRPEVNLRGGGLSPTVSARVIPTGTPGISVAQNTETEALLRSLDLGIANITAASKNLLQEERANQFKEGQLAQVQNQKDWATAVNEGAVPQTANPWFIKGYQNQDGRVAGLTYYQEMRRAYAASEAKGSDDPAVYQKFVQEFTKGYMAKLGPNLSGDFADGFKTTSDSAQSQLASEHAQHAEAQIVAKQEANTGAEVNSILNSTTNPREAAAKINALGDKLKLAGMPPEKFEAVVAQAIIAKAKLGNGAMLETLDHVRTGGPIGGEGLTSAQTIARIEGNGRYDQVGNEVTYKDGTKDRAYGKYQVMGANVPSWTAEVLGVTMTPQQFLKDSDAQEKVFKAKFGALEQKYGREGAARAWFAGEGGMNNLDAKDVNGMTVGRYGTLASNPKVQMARVDTQQFLTEKARGDVRWAWAQDDRQWSLDQRKWALESHAREMERWQYQKAEMGRHEQSRSLLAQITLSTMADPGGSIANNKSTIAALAAIDPTAAREAAKFQDSWLTARERVNDADERPVLAMLQKTMIDGAGNPAVQKQVMLDAQRLFNEGKINKDTMGRLLDDALKFGTFDPAVQRKLQAPEVQRIRAAATQSFMSEGQQSVYGSKAIDAVVTEQVINQAVIDHLKRDPNADGHELAATALTALQSVLPTFSPNLLGTGKANSLNTQAEDAKRNLKVPGPLGARPTTDQMAAGIAPSDAQEFINSVIQAYNAGGLPAQMKAIADFDARVGIPGLGAKLIELHAKPPAAKR